MLWPKNRQLVIKKVIRQMCNRNEWHSTFTRKHSPICWGRTINPEKKLLIPMKTLHSICAVAGPRTKHIKSCPAIVECMSATRSWGVDDGQFQRLTDVWINGHIESKEPPKGKGLPCAFPHCCQRTNRYLWGSWSTWECMVFNKSFMLYLHCSLPRPRLE